MTIMNYQQFIESHFIHRQQIADGFLKGLKRTEMVEIAKVLAYEGLSIHDEGDSVLEIGAQGQDGLLRRESGHCSRGVTAAATKDRSSERAGTNYGIIHATCYRAFSDEEGVRNLGEAPQGIFVFVGNRLAGTIGAGHDENRRRCVRKQQVVQRRIGQHHTEFVVVGRNTW